MDSTNFQPLYREAYAQLGFDLDSQSGVSDVALEKVEKRLGVRIPTALRDYYSVAGNEKSLNCAFNRLLPADALELHHAKLPFIEENQWAVIWGIDLRDVPDPPVFQGPIVNGEAPNWFPECDCCSGFLVFMLHLQAAYGGGMALTASGPASAHTKSSLDAGWNFRGEVNGMRAYSRQGQAVCLAKWPELSQKSETWMVFAGASHAAALRVIQHELSVSWGHQRDRSPSLK